MVIQPPLRLALAGGLVALGLVGCQGLGRPDLIATTECPDIDAEIYFEPDSDQLGPEARALVSQAAQQAAGCRVTAVEVRGLADAPGASEANLALSRRRAEAVKAALSAARLPAAQFHVQALGDADALTADGLANPMRRRVELTLRLAPPR